MGLDKEQQRAFNIGISGENMFLSGMAGVGKTYVMKRVIEHYRKENKNVLVCAYTKMAALNLDPNSGETIHAAFGALPGKIGLKEPDAVKRLIQSPAAGADVIIIDEISLCSKFFFSFIADALELIERVTERHIPIIVMGDFLQISPFAKKFKGPEYAFEARAWKKLNFRYVSLEEPHRQLNPDFIKHLKNIRFGVALEEAVAYLQTHSCYLMEDPNAITLCARRATAKKKNKEVIDSLPGKSNTYLADTNDPKYCEKAGMYAALELKKGTFVMTIANDPYRRYFNGSTGVIEELKKESVVIRFSDSTKEKPHVVEIEAVERTEGDRYAKQLPIIPAYALTIHKAQGITLEAVNVDPNCFAEGQLYVALSRVKDVKRLYITSELKVEQIKVNRKAKRFYLDFYLTILKETVGMAS